MYNRLQYGNDQRCTYAGCKNWDYDNLKNNNEDKWNKCSECWGAGELSYYNGWDGKTGFTQQEVLYAHQEQPFVRRYYSDTTGHCELQCQTGFWSNYKSSYNTASEMNDQRCTYDNCKNWDYTDNTSDPLPSAKTCTTCWTKDDVASSTWPAKKTYAKNSGWHTTEPFKLDSNVCKVQCDSDFWSNAVTESDPLKQRCTSLNCKTWDHTNELENSIVSFYNEIKVLSEDQGIHVNEPITTEWQIKDNRQENWYYVINEFLIYIHKKTAAIIATWKQDGSQTEQDWQFIFNSNGYMRQFIKESKLNKGYVQRDANNRLQFFEFAIDCPIGHGKEYSLDNHADTTDCTVQDVVNDFASVQINGIQRAQSARNIHLYAVKHSKSIMGFIENQSDIDNVKNQHFIFGRLSDNKDSIVGIFVGQHATNNGVFYAKRVPSLQSYPIYDHIEAATLSYPYDTMTTQGKNFDYKFNGVVIDVIMENVNDALAATKSMDYKTDVTIDAQIIIQNQSPYEVKLNKI